MSNNQHLVTTSKKTAAKLFPMASFYSVNNAANLFSMAPFRGINNAANGTWMGSYIRGQLPDPLVAQSV